MGTGIVNECHKSIIKRSPYDLLQLDKQLLSYTCLKSIESSLVITPDLVHTKSCMLSYAKSGTARTRDRLNEFKNGKTQQFKSGGVGK